MGRTAICQQPRSNRHFVYGARGTRTPDLLGAIQALSQLSYSPSRVGRALTRTVEEV
jgi:hypothetical protein